MSEHRAALTALLIKYEAPADMITPDATLDDLGLDSLAVVEIFLALQEQLAIPGLDDSKAHTGLTVEQTVAMLKEQIEAERNGARQ